MVHRSPAFARLELSTQLLIKEAMERGINVEVLDEHENILCLSWNGRKEYVMQATRTSADNYISPLLMNNKAVTKRLLTEAGIRVPEGMVFTTLSETTGVAAQFRQGSWIIKPNTTNFGIGITKLEKESSDQEILTAFRLAFSHDNQVLAEEFIEGFEYRFLVIDGSVRAVLHRVPAHVVGDGRHSIADLVAEKNRDPRRGNGYRLPLEKLQLGEIEIAVLAESGLDINSVPQCEETVYIPKNSNITTGGDGIDMTGKLHPEYQRIAILSAEALDAKICGVDMIIAEGTETESALANTNYAVIELNFNPALHIHDFPTVGENRKVESYVLDLLMQANRSRG